MKEACFKVLLLNQFILTYKSNSLFLKLFYGFLKLADLIKNADE